MNYFLVSLGRHPEHLKTCIEQIQRIETDAAIYVCANEPLPFTDTRLTYCDSRDFNIPDIKGYFDRSDNPLWKTALQRIFYINAFLQTKKESIVHFDNDVLIYYPFSHIDLKGGIQITPHKHTEYTFGYSYIADIDSFNTFSNKIYNTVLMGEDAVKREYKDTNEMRLLGIHKEGHITDLPVHPTLGNINNYIFDPSSYGQYIGGTPNGHGPGFIDNEQLVGSIIQNGLSKIYFSEAERKPFMQVNDHEYRLYNLHIHNKKLHDYV